MMCRTVVLAMLVAVVSTPTAVASFIDQDTGRIYGGILNADTPAFVWQQGVTADAEGLLVGVDVYPQRADIFPLTRSFEFFVFSEAPWKTGEPDYSTIVTYDAQDASKTWQYIDVREANIWLEPGDRFSIGVQGIGDGASLYQHYQIRYPGGELWLNGAVLGTGDDSSDMAFRTHMVIPEPSSSLLGTISASAFIAWTRRRRR